MAGASCSIAVLTLPVFGGALPLLVFQVLEWLAIALVYALLGLAVVSILVLVIPLLVVLLCCVKCSSRTTKQEGFSNCCRCMRSALLFVGRQLCVNTFPTLFKLHKARSGNSKQTRKFMLFLDRKVESSTSLVAAFCAIVFCIFCSSAAVFFRYFPVERSTECLEKDSHGQSLFCYSNVNSSLIDPNLPVDCASYSVTELRELEFECYAIVFPAGLGIAVAAAFGLAEVGIVGVTIFIKVTEGFFKKTKNSKNLPRCCCCYKWTCANKLYVCSSMVLLVTVSLVSFSCAILILTYFICTIDRMQPLHFLYYLAYPLLPALICLPLIYITCKMKAHCDRGEYISFGADQWPLHRCDWDVGFDGEQDKLSRERQYPPPREIEKTLVTETRGSKEYIELREIQL